MGRMVQTVTGPVSSDDLGTTLMHEHFVFGFPGYQGDVTHGGFDGSGFIDEVTAFLETMREFGLRTIVDATPNECGRDPLLLREVARKTGLNIICATGYYTENLGSSVYFKFRLGSGADVVGEIHDMMKAELNQGIAGTGVRAGVIKLATGKGAMSEYEEAFFRAAARLAVEDDSVRIITHTEAGTGALIQADYFLEHGVNPAHVAIGHIDGCTDMNELLGVMERGFYASFDRIGFDGFLGTPKDSRRLACLFGLVGSGYGDRILVSHDYVFRDLGRKPQWPAEVREAIERLNWDHLFRRFLPRLEAMGIDAARVRRLVTENPRSFWAG